MVWVFDGKIGGVLCLGALKHDQSGLTARGAVTLSSLPRVVKITVTYQ